MMKVKATKMILKNVLLVIVKHYKSNWLRFTFQLDVTTLSIVPVVNFMIMENRNVPSSRSSSATFYLDQEIGGTAYFRIPRQFFGDLLKSY